MEIKIRWKDMSEHPKLVSLLEEKASRIFEFKFVEGDIKAEFHHYESNKSYTLRLNVHVHNSNIIRAEAHSEHAEETITQAVNKIIDQLRKHKTKVNSNKH